MKDCGRHCRLGILDRKRVLHRAVILRNVHIDTLSILHEKSVSNAPHPVVTATMSIMGWSTEAILIIFVVSISEGSTVQSQVNGVTASKVAK